MKSSTKEMVLYFIITGLWAGIATFSYVWEKRMLKKYGPALETILEKRAEEEAKKVLNEFES